MNLTQRLMRLALPLIIIIILLIHVQALIRLKPVAWSQQTWILQDILILLTTVIYPARHKSTYLLVMFVNHLDIILSLGIIRLCHMILLREITTVYTIMLDIRPRNYFTILVPDLMHTNMINDQFNSSIRKILSDRIQV